MARQESAGTIINRAAVEVGLTAVQDPFSTTDEGFTQLVGLLNVAGQELAKLRDWNELLKSITVDTSTDITSGNQYVLPDDYDRLIPQTGWDQTNDVPVMGPLSPQDWSWLEGRDLASNTIYIAYRQYLGNLEFYPTTVPTGRTLNFQYVSINWATTADGLTPLDTCVQASDIVLLDPLLMQKFLKAKYLIAKSMPTANDAKMEFDTILTNRFGNDNSAPILNGGRFTRNFPYLNALYNTPDTNFGG